MRTAALGLFLFALVSLSVSAFAAAKIEGDWIVVAGKGNTLESVARDVNDAAILSFDPETGSATAAKSFRVEGELTIGGVPTSGTIFRYVNSLEFDVGKCGQARIALRNPKSETQNPQSAIRNPQSGNPQSEASPRLVVANSRIATVRTEEGNDACKNEGNLIEAAAGALVLNKASISGNFILRASGGNVEIADSIVSTSNHTGVAVGGLDGGKTKIAGLKSLDHKMYGLELGPAGEAPGAGQQALMLENCTIRGGGADVHVRGALAVVARDCDFDSIRFAGEGGGVKRQWTVTVRTPAPGCRVVAESEKGAGVAETVEATADTSGVARLVLTEYVARPGGLDYLKAGQNDSTPHRLTVRSADGKTAVGELRNYRVLARGQEVRIP